MERTECLIEVQDSGDDETIIFNAYGFDQEGNIVRVGICLDYLQAGRVAQALLAGRGGSTQVIEIL